MGVRRRATVRRARDLRALAREPATDIVLLERLFL